MFVCYGRTMNPLEELQTAHARLTELQENSTQGRWVPDLSDKVKATIKERERVVSFGGYLGDDAELIVTLHRTIGAQLELLMEAMEDYEGVLLGDCPYPVHVLALACAINGEES